MAKKMRLSLSIIWGLGFLLNLFPLALAQRQMENLNRGVVAVRRADDQVFVSWRLFATDPESIAFNLS